IATLSSFLRRFTRTVARTESWYSLVVTINCNRSARALRILHVVDTLSAGGAETWLMELLRFWRRPGADVPQIDILATSGNVGLYDDEARALGARIFYLRFGRSNLASFVRGWRQILRSGRYTAIHDHQEYISGWHFLMGAGCLPRIRIAHAHNPLLGLK